MIKEVEAPIGKMKVFHSIDDDTLFARGYVTVDGMTEYIEMRPVISKCRRDADFYIYKNTKLKSRILPPNERQKYEQKHYLGDNYEDDGDVLYKF